MTSSILQGIQNPQIADIGGRFRQGTQRREAREAEEKSAVETMNANKIQAEIIKNSFGTKFADLILKGGKTPESVAQFAEAMNVAGENKQKRLFGNIMAADKLFKEGVPPEEIAALFGEETQLIASEGTDVTFMSEFIEDLASGDPEKIEAQRAAIGQMANGMRPAKDNQKQTNVLRSNVKDVTKDLRKVDSAFRKIQKAGTKATPAADMSLIFSYMKILDPGSTVREGEFATAQQTTGLPGQVVNAYNRAREGTRLNATQRTDFIAQAESLFNAERESADNSISNILQQSDQDGIDRVKILGKQRLLEFNDRISALGSQQNGLPQGTVDNGDGTFTLPTGETVEPE